MRYLVITFMLCVAIASEALAAPLQINSVRELPTNQAIEVVFPDGVRRIVAASEEPIPNGVSTNRGVYIAQRLATIRAEATLAKFIQGAEFEETAIVKETVNSVNDQAEYSVQIQIETISKMRTVALRGIEAIEVLKDTTNGIVKVVVGVSFDSITTADDFKNRLDRRESSKSRTQNSSTAENSHWVHPSLNNTERSNSTINLPKDPEKAAQVLRQNFSDYEIEILIRTLMLLE